MLAWCDYVDEINPNPDPKGEVVPYPKRCDDISNEPLPDSITNTEENSSHSITLTKTPEKSPSVKPSKNQSADKNRSSVSLYDPKGPKSNQIISPQPVNQTADQAPSTSLQPSNSHQGFTILHTVCLSMLHDLAAQTDLDTLLAYFDTRAVLLDQVVDSLNSLPTPYANTLPNLDLDIYVQHECHPLLLHTFKPIATTGYGNCMYNALSLCLCGTEDLSVVIRVLAAYALVKHRTTMMDTLTDTVQITGNLTLARPRNASERRVPASMSTCTRECKCLYSQVVYRCYTRASASTRKSLHRHRILVNTCGL